MKENRIEDMIKIIERKIKEAENYSDITGLYLTLDEELCNAFNTLLSDYKRVLKENESYQKSDYETVCLENNELREITDRIQSEYNDLLKDNFKLKNELETKRKEYQETYKDVREEIKELKKENEEYKGYYKADKRIIHNLQKENEELKEKYDKDTHTLQNQLDLANADGVEKDKMIKAMAKYLNSTDIDEDICKTVSKEFDCTLYQNENFCINCIIGYFKEEVRKENE